MKKSELKSLIQRIVTETRRLRTENLSGGAAIDQLNAAGPSDSGEGEQLLKKFEDALKRHDWYFERADGNTHQRGRDSERNISHLRYKLSQLGYKDKAEKLYQKHMRANFGLPPLPESFSGDKLNLGDPADMGDEKHPTGGAHPGATPHDDEFDDSGYDLNDPKHPSYAERAADRYDMERSRRRDEPDDRRVSAYDTDTSSGLERDLNKREFDGLNDPPDDDAMMMGQYPGMDENKEFGVSTMKKSPDKKKNTQMGYEDKTITSTDKPTEKKEGKKLPIIQKKSNTETDHRADKGSTPTPPAGEKKEGKALPVGGHGAKGLKEEILKMVRESVEEMARTKGALGKNNPNRTAPIKNTGVNYKKVGATDYPTASNAAEKPALNTSPAATARTEGAVEEFLKYNPKASSQEILASLSDSHTEETPYNLSPDAISKAMNQSKANADKDIETEPTDVDIKNVSKQKYDSLRNRLLKARGLAPK